jgi:phosphopantothenoylcysteine decarboxylase / phosphopantothenate---cysteine ligase
MKLRGTNILITAGPTWAVLDAVRVIGNTASGETGFLLAGELARRGARVTVLLGPCVIARVFPGSYAVKRFTFFHEALALMEREVRTGKYACVVHSAAICDYLPRRARSAKVPSGKIWNLRLDPAPKIIDRIKKWDASVYAIGFKYEPGYAKKRLLDEANILMARSHVDAVVANTVSQGIYQAYLVAAGNTHARGPYRSKSALVSALVTHITEALWKISS